MAIKDRLQQPDAASPWYGDLPVESLYTAGVAGDRFLRELRDKGRFMGTVCEECEEVYVPGKAFCPTCLGRLEKWVAVGPQGTLDSWTMLFVGLDGKPRWTATNGPANGNNGPSSRPALTETFPGARSGTYSTGLWITTCTPSNG